MVWPSHDRSVVDSPWPAAAKTYAALLRKLALRTSSRRSSARAIVIGLPERLERTVAPANAASALGGTGTHMSSQISTWSRRSGRSVAAKIRSGPSGTSSPATRIVVPLRSSPGAKWRRS